MSDVKMDKPLAEELVGKIPKKLKPEIFMRGRYGFGVRYLVNGKDPVAMVEALIEASQLAMEGRPKKPVIRYQIEVEQITPSNHRATAQLTV